MRYFVIEYAPNPWHTGFTMRNKRMGGFKSLAAAKRSAAKCFTAEIRVGIRPIAVFRNGKEV